jgi:hypothetical protein
MIGFLREHTTAIAVLVALLLATVIDFYSAKSVRVLLEDVRHADELLEFLVSQIGYGPAKKQGRELIFKPSAVQFIMYSARTIRAVVDGSSIILSGNMMFVRKLVRVIRSCETAG